MGLGKLLVYLLFNKNWSEMKQSLELLMFAFLWHWPVSSFLFLFLFFFLPSTLADSFSFFACPLFLSALVYLWGALLCFWSIKYRALLNIPEASGEHLFSCRWLSLLSALEVCNSAGTTRLMYGEWRQSGGQRWMEQMVKLVKGFKLFNPPSSKILIYLKMSLYFP